MKHRRRRAKKERWKRKKIWRTTKNVSLVILGEVIALVEKSIANIAPFGEVEDTVRDTFKKL